MNTEKKNESIKQASELIASRAEVELGSIYHKAYHEGRHDYRNSVKGFLVINPEYEEILKKMAEDPCEGCSHHLTMVKAACLKSNECKLKQEQFVALDILKHYESIRTDN